MASTRFLQSGAPFSGPHVWQQNTSIVGGIEALKPFIIFQVPDTDAAGDENSQICVVRTLECYIHLTEKYRTRNKNRLIIQRGIYRGVKEQIISRYVKEIVVLAHSGQDPE